MHLPLLIYGRFVKLILRPPDIRPPLARFASWTFFVPFIEYFCALSMKNYLKDSASAPMNFCLSNANIKLFTEM